MANLKELKIEIYDKSKHKKDIDTFANNLRDDDINELKAIGYTNLKEVYLESLEGSEISIVVKSMQNEMLCIFGLSMIKTMYGRGIWCLCSKKIIEYKKEFLVNSYLVIEEWLNKYEKLYNYVDCRNEKTIRWLKWLGAKFSEPFPFGKENTPFILFTIQKEE